jgi:glutaminyl-tRNA synthetase
MHWVSARHGVNAKVRLYDRLFSTENPEENKAVDFKENLNPDSLQELTDCVLESSLAEAAPGTHFQFERQGYFFTDPVDSRQGVPVFNRTVGLRDTWEKVKDER